jgi:regulatory protein
MPCIVSIRPLGRSGRKFVVELDHGKPIVLSSIVARTLGLFAGRELAEDDISSILDQEQRSQAMASALRLLSYRPRSEAEIRRHLASRSIATTAEEATVTRLKELGYLDDAAFASAWRESRERSSPRGARMLQYELERKGVPREIAETSLQGGATDEENAWQAVKQRLRRLTASDYNAFRSKLTAFLHYRGFPASVVRRTVQRAWEEVNSCHEV